MLAISVEKPHSLAVVEASSPAPEQGEVRVRVRRAGICGSDVHILHGSNPFARYPRIIGHEFAGEIESVGPDVSALAVGDRVVVDPVLSCGHCYPCRIGRPNVCANLEVLRRPPRRRLSRPDCCSSAQCRKGFAQPAGRDCGSCRALLDRSQCPQPHRMRTRGHGPDLWGRHRGPHGATSGQAEGGTLSGQRP